MTFALVLCTAALAAELLFSAVVALAAELLFSAVVVAGAAASALASLPSTQPGRPPRLFASSLRFPLAGPAEARNPAALQRASSSMHTSSWEARRELMYVVGVL